MYLTVIALSPLHIVNGGVIFWYIIHVPDQKSGLGARSKRRMLESSGAIFDGLVHENNGDQEKGTECQNGGRIEAPSLQNFHRSGGECNADLAPIQIQNYIHGFI